MRRQRVAVLGAGPAGLGAALLLARRGHEVTVLERAPEPGGLAASFEVTGVRVDHGSHRLHPSCPPEILAELGRELGVDLQRRHRHGRIRLGGRWVAFPPSVGNLVRTLPPRLAMGLAADAIRSPFRAPRADTFAEVVRAGLGATMLDQLYGPYARKIWGVAPDELSGELARRRVGARTPGALARRVLDRDERVRRGQFWYPRRGFGQIPEALARAAAREGAEIACRAAVDAIELTETNVEVHAGRRTVVADHVWSTLPLPVVASLAHAPAPVLEAAARLEYRALTLVYLAFDVPFVSEYDASYFPGADVCASRVSEPKRYRDGTGSDPPDRTVLCAEVPCAFGDDVWNAAPEALGARLVTELAAQDLTLPDPTAVVARRISHAYPTYRVGFEVERAAIDEWALGEHALLSLGRQGLFAHDNTHHALATAWAAADALTAGGRVDPKRWEESRARFAHHVVED